MSLCRLNKTSQTLLSYPLAWTSHCPRKTSGYDAAAGSSDGGGGGLAGSDDAGSDGDGSDDAGGVGGCDAPDDDDDHDDHDDHALPRHLSPTSDPHLSAQQYRGGFQTVLHSGVH